MKHFFNAIMVLISSMQQFFYETFLQCNSLSTGYLFLQCNSSSMKHFFNVTFCQQGTYFFIATVLLWNISSMQHFVNTVPISSTQKGILQHAIFKEQKLFYATFLQCNIFLIQHKISWMWQFSNAKLMKHNIS